MKKKDYLLPPLDSVLVVVCHFLCLLFQISGLWCRFVCAHVVRCWVLLCVRVVLVWMWLERNWVCEARMCCCVWDWCCESVQNSLCSCDRVCVLMLCVCREIGRFAMWICEFPAPLLFMCRFCFIVNGSRD